MTEQDGKGGLWTSMKRSGFGMAVASMFSAQNAQQVAFFRSVMKEQRSTALFDMQLRDIEFVVFDLETSGFQPDTDEILSFGAVSIKGGEMSDDRFYRVVKPRRPIPKHIIELTGMTNEEADQAQGLTEVLPEFLSFIHKKMLIAHSAGHDKAFLNAALWKLSKVRLAHRVLDTMMLAKWLHPKHGSYDLDSVLHLYGIPIKNRHHALADSMMTAKLWLEMMKTMPGRNVMTLGDLYAHLSRH